MNRTTENTESTEETLTKWDRMDLGLTLLSMCARPGIPLTQEDISAWAGCTRGGIWNIERRGLQKLKKAVFLRRDPVLIELLESIIPSVSFGTEGSVVSNA